MIGRRAFVAMLGGGLTAPLAARAQQATRRYRIAFLANDPPASTICVPDPTDVSYRAFREGLRELGYAEGMNISIECRSAEGDYNRLLGLARDLVQTNPVVLVASSAPASLAAKAATSTLPIVSVYAADPVELGLVATLARPGGNVTGISALASDYVAKSLQLMKEMLPHATRAGVLGHEPNPTFAIYQRELEGAAEALRLRLEFRKMATAPDIERAVAALAALRVDGVVVMHQPFTFTNRARFVQALGKHRLPAMFGSSEAVEAGGLVSYAVSVPAVFRRAATYVDKILKGARPADLPVEQPTTFELAINMKTARTLGLTISPPLLARANKLVE